MPTISANEREGIAKAAELFVHLGASEVFMFGSVVAGRVRASSDIDMAVAGFHRMQFQLL